MRYKLLVLLFFVTLLPMEAQAQNQIRLHWDRYDTVVTVNPDGSMDVQEQQVLVVDQGRLSRMTREFITGDQGRVTNIQVLEDGQPYTPGREIPGTYSGGDAGDQAQIQLWFRDPDVNRHTFTIAYTVNDTLIDRGDQATLDWSFFWGSAGAPEIRDGSVEIRFPTQVNASELRVDYAGAPARAVSESNPLRLELTDPIQGDELRVQATFPRAVLAANAAFRSAQTTTRPRANQPVAPAPNPNTIPAPVPAGGGFDFMFCFVVLIFLMIAFSSIRSSARRRQSRGYPTSYGPGQPLGSDPFFGPVPRGRRRRRYGGWGGGWGGGIFPPIIITPPTQPHDHDRSFGSPLDGTPHDNSGGGGSSWGDSGGSGSSWGDSGGSSSSWGDSGGGGSSWGDSGGGGSSWGGGGGDSGGGSDNGGSGGGSFG